MRGIPVTDAAERRVHDEGIAELRASAIHSQVEGTEMEVKAFDESDKTRFERSDSHPVPRWDWH